MPRYQSPVEQDPDLLERAWALPVALLYRDDGYETQENWTNCGPTSAANLLQSIGLDLDQKEVAHMAGVRTFFGFLAGGLTLDEEPTYCAAPRAGRSAFTATSSLDIFASTCEPPTIPASALL